jgi:hypothetical protein
VVDISHLVPVSWGGEAPDENYALSPVSASDGGVIGAITLLKASPVQSLATHSCCSEGNPRYGYSGSDDDDVLASLYLLRTTFLDPCRLEEARAEWCSSTA